jgi:hypothetical protein
MSFLSLGPILAALFSGAAIFYLFRMLQDSDCQTVQKPKEKS